MTPELPADSPDDSSDDATEDLTARRGVPWWLILAAGVAIGIGAVLLWPEGSGDLAVPSTTTASVVAPPASPVLPPTVAPAECGPGEARQVNEILVPECGAFLGTTDRRVADLDLATQELALGRNFSMVRIYKVGLNDPFFNAEETILANEGRILVYSWKVDNQPGGWARVAAGEYDAELENAARQIVASGHTTMFSLHHEPEDNVPNAGTNADYAAMMRHAHGVMEPIAGEQLVWFINYRGHSFGSYDQVEAMYPGDEVLDWISWNPYNWFGCQDLAEWKSFEGQAALFYEWATTNHPGKPLMIGETASNEDPDVVGRQAEWITEMSESLQTRYPEVRALIWFQQSSATNFCDRRWDTSQESIDAMKALANDPYFGG